MQLLALALFILTCPLLTHAFDITLPTANHSILLPGHETEYYQPTLSGKLESGMFGCVRNGGRRFHEGIDIRCLLRDRRKEPIDPVVAVSDGFVAFINHKPGQSNYGRYVVLSHIWDDVSVFTLYAHLRSLQPELTVGEPVRLGQQIGVLGRSTNTQEGISKSRAHLHFEIGFLLNPNFHLWYSKRVTKAPPFGNFNGKNIVGLDPTYLYRKRANNPNLNFLQHVQQIPIAFTILLSHESLPWVELHPEQIQKTTNQPKSSLVAYEIGVTAWGLPTRVWPRFETELAKPQYDALQQGIPVLKTVSETSIAQMGCRSLVHKSSRGWILSQRGKEWAEQLSYTPNRCK